MRDAELIAKFLAQRSEDAFAAIVERHTDLVYGVCLRVLGDSNQAEDAAQATFMVLLREIGRLDAGRPLSGWLFRVAERVARNMRRSQVRLARREQAAVAGAGSPGSDALWQELRPELDGALASLPASQRETIVLRYYRELSRAEIASELKCSELTVRTRLSRGLEALRERLGRRGVQVSAVALSGNLAGNLSAAAPATLAKAITAGCLGKGLVSASAAAAANAASQAIFWAKAASATLTVCAVLVAGTVGVIGVRVLLTQKPATLEAGAEEPVAAPPRAQAAPTDKGRAMPPGYAEVFREDFKTFDRFNGKSGRWKTQLYFYNPNSPTIGRMLNDDLQLYVEPEYAGTSGKPLGLNPFSIRDGKLAITADRAPVAAKPFLANFAFTSGMISSEPAFAQLYGWFEIRMKPAKGQGVNTCCWMLPTDRSWPPDIQIAATKDGVRIMQGYNDDSREWKGGLIPADSITGQFHTYALEWTDAELVWYIDGVETRRAKNFIHKPMYVVVNLNVEPGGAGAEFPATALIEYIRVCKKTGQK